MLSGLQRELFAKANKLCLAGGKLLVFKLDIHIQAGTYRKTGDCMICALNTF
jgi:hypothetical protein